MINSDIHVHTTYCDGKSTAEEIAEKAISMNMTSLGFSSHEYTSFDTSFCMSIDDTEKYIDDVKRLQKLYKDKIEIYLGTERDYFSEKSEISYDYVIGSVHYIKAQNTYLSVDESTGVMEKNVSEFFGGDYIKYAAAYFETVCRMAEEKSFDVAGHFNLVTKFNRHNRYFDEASPKYRAAAYEALKITAESCGIFEMNTGAVSRGYTDVPYPDEFMLKCIKELGAKVILSSDSHSKDTLCFKFGDCIEMLKSCGYDSVVVLSGGKFTEKGI